MEEREPKIIIATGTRGVGKTYLTNQLIKSYALPNPRTGKKARKVLIYDVNMEYTDYKPIDPNHVVDFVRNPNIEIRRVLPKHVADGRVMGIDEMVSLLNKLLMEFRGGLLLLEDINRYMVGTQSKEIIGAICTTRHRDVDIYMHLQSLAAMTPRLWQNTNVVRFHKQIDSVVKYKDRIPNYELFQIAQNIVNNKYKNGNERFYLYVDNEMNTISGMFSTKDFQEAAQQYLGTNQRKVTMTANEMGGKQHRQKAINFLLKDMEAEYYNGLK